MIDTSSEAWRAECEARWLANKPVPEIAAYLEGVEKKRGKEAADKLRKDAREAWKAKKEQSTKK